MRRVIDYIDVDVDKCRCTKNTIYMYEYIYISIIAFVITVISNNVLRIFIKMLNSNAFVNILIKNRCRFI